MNMAPESKDRLAGFGLIAASILTIAAMLHHPTAAGTPSGEIAEALSRLAPMLRLVHGALIGLLLVLFYGVCSYALRRGLDRPLVLAGLVSFASGMFAMLIPATLDGFVLPALAERAGSHADVAAAFPAMLSLGFAMLLAFAKLGSVLISFGIVLFSVGLMHERGALRWFGLSGLITVLPGALAILVGALELNKTGMTLMAASWCVWFIGLGIFMARGRL